MTQRYLHVAPDFNRTWIELLSKENYEKCGSSVTVARDEKKKNAKNFAKMTDKST